MSDGARRVDPTERVDELRAHLLKRGRRLEERVGVELTGGVRHRDEARVKRDPPARRAPPGCASRRTGASVGRRG